MRLEQLWSFLAVVETGSFQAAASRCGLSQPTISRQIQALEADLGLPLLHRTGPVKPTVAGQVLLPHAQKIWREWQTVMTELQALHQGEQAEVCVAAIHSVCSYLLPQLLPHFYRQFPHTQLRVTALGSDRALKVLKDGLVDVAIVMAERHLLKEPEWWVQSLYREPVQILMASDHPLAARSHLTWAELAPYPHVVFKDGYGMRRLVTQEFARRGLTWQAAIELNTPEAFLSVIRHSRMLAVLPQSALQSAKDDPALAVRPFAPGEQPPLREVIAITTQDRQTIPPIAHLMALLAQATHEPCVS
ncbi:MAG: LysR family transcriptional regulator [Gloeomargarita sp. SKYG116]|nr:LysR family transcriptional regulator [Gloeomargarita sp. SKYG116]MDW8401923.1 LysR family transcriptional regulator [Gloeomargarita sp. SKYGB_i_bin116]